MEYTTSEKLTADRIICAIEELADALDSAHAMRWHKSDDRNLKLCHVGVTAALAAQRITRDAAKAIMDAPHCAEMSRLPAWNGYPQDDQQSPNPETSK